MDKELKAVESIEELKEYINNEMQITMAVIKQIGSLEYELQETKEELQDLKAYTENLEESYNTALEELPDLETKIDNVKLQLDQLFDIGVSDLKDTNEMIWDTKAKLIEYIDACIERVGRTDYNLDQY